MLIPFAQPLDLPNTLESGQAFRWRRLSNRGRGSGGGGAGVVCRSLIPDP
jgi:hypothetical protein